MSKESGMVVGYKEGIVKEEATFPGGGDHLLLQQENQTT